MTKPPRSGRIFLCGGNHRGNFRSKICNELKNHRCTVFLAEQALDWYKKKHFNNDLLELEKYYAALVSIIPIVCESHGSVAELGAFINDVYIREKVFIIIKKKYYSGDKSDSFIRRGLIKNYENFILDGTGIYPIDDKHPNKDIKKVAKSITNHKFRQTHCDFMLEHFQILLLADIINALVICDRKEIKEHFKYAMKYAFPDRSKNKAYFAYKNFESRLNEMLFVLEKLKMIEITIKNKKYYTAKHEDWFLDYRFKDYKKHKKINEVREQISNGIEK